MSYRFLLISSTFYCSKNFYPKQLFRLFEYFWLHYLVVSISHYLYSVFKVHFYHKAFLLYVVGPSGLEPPTSRLSGVRSNHLSYEPISMWFCRLLSFRTLFLLRTEVLGGDKRDRTADPLLAKQVLSQLSYTPIFPFRKPRAFKIKQRLLQVFRF